MFKPNNGDKNKQINLSKEYYEISCFYPVAAWETYEFVIGFGTGKILYYKQGISKDILTLGLTGTNKVEKIVLQDEKANGSILHLVWHENKVLSWATKDSLKLAYYGNGLASKNPPQKVVEINPPDYSKYPELKTSYLIKPSILLIKSKSR